MNKFGEELAKNAKLTGWNVPGADILNIPTVDNPAVQYNVITKYGRLTAADIRAHYATYTLAHKRQAQNNVMMYKCIKNSIEDE